MRSMAGTGTITGMALRSETEYLRRQNNLSIRKQKKLRTIKIKGIHLLFILTVLFFIAFTIYKTWEFVLTWDKLSIQYFRVSGASAPGKTDAATWGEINKTLSRYKGHNILTLSFAALKADLASIPEIKDVSISRNLPSTVAVQFTLRKPIFQVEVPYEGKYTIIDKEGIVLYQRSEKKEELITVKDTPSFEVKKIQPYLSCLEDIKPYIEYVGFREPYGLLVKLNNVEGIFYPGDIGFAEKIAYYLKLRKKLTLDNKIIKSVDLRFTDRIYLEYEEQVPEQEQIPGQETPPGQHGASGAQPASDTTREEVM